MTDAKPTKAAAKKKDDGPCAECFPHGFAVFGAEGQEYTNAACEHGAWVNPNAA